MKNNKRYGLRVFTLFLFLGTVFFSRSIAQSEINTGKVEWDKFNRGAPMGFELKVEREGSKVQLHLNCLACTTENTTVSILRREEDSNMFKQVKYLSTAALGAMEADQLIVQDKYPASSKKDAYYKVKVVRNSSEPVEGLEVILPALN